MKATLIGDGTVGKTCLLSVYKWDFFPVDYVPTVADECHSVVEYKGMSYDLSIWDTAGQDAYDKLRHVSYSHTDVLLACYAIDCKSSFLNMTSKWIPEFNKFCPETPVVLVGTKLDLRGWEKEGDFVTYCQGRRMSKDIGAAHFIECSALSRINVQAVFEEAVKAVVELSKTPRSSCLALCSIL